MTEPAEARHEATAVDVSADSAPTDQPATMTFQATVDPDLDPDPQPDLVPDSDPDPARAAPPPPPPLIPYRTRRRRWGRRVAKTAATLFVVSTLASVAYNAATDGRMAVPPGLTYVQTGDVSTRYRTWGTSGSPIVLVHGAVETADTWQALAPLLAAQGHRVYALDLDGWGYTQRVAPFDIGHQSAQLLGFIRALRLDRPMLVGHSSGAAIAAAATLASPGSVGGVLFLDGDGLATGAGQKSPLTDLFLDPYRTTLMRLGIRSDLVVRAVYSAACGPGCPRLDAAGVDQWRRPLQVPGAEESLWAMLKLGVPGLPPERLAGLAALPLPKAVVFGGDDSSYDPDAPATTAARIGAPAPTVIPGAHHLTSVNSPAAVAAAVAALDVRVRQGMD